MITVIVHINGNVVACRSAINRSGADYGEGLQTYEMDCGTIIQHKFEDGAVALAARMLKEVKNLEK